MIENWWEPTPKNLLFTKNDPQDLRLGDLATAVLPRREDIAKLPSPCFALAGYPDDEGIAINGGRIGAQDGPNHIRDFFYRLTPHFAHTEPPQIFDLGNLKRQYSLEQRHDEAKRVATHVLEHAQTYVGLGGGHDYAYADGAAFIQYCQKHNHRPLILNFDAHLDVRPTTKGLSSGTPFFRLLTEFTDFDFAEIGVQAHCNSAEHFQWAQEQGARVITYEDILLSGQPLTSHVATRLQDWLLKPRPVFVSIDIDGFSSSQAMGCSQSWATGFLAQDFYPLAQLLKKRLKVKTLGIYEVSPPLDRDNRTAKLAAQIMHWFL